MIARYTGILRSANLRNEFWALTPNCLVPADELNGQSDRVHYRHKRALIYYVPFVLTFVLTWSWTARRALISRRRFDCHSCARGLFLDVEKQFLPSAAAINDGA